MQMRLMTLATLLGVLVLMGPMAGTSSAADAPWQTLNAVQAMPLDADEMNGVTGKAVTSLFSFLSQNGQTYAAGVGSVQIWTSVSGASVNVSGSFGTAVLTFK